MAIVAPRNSGRKRTYNADELMAAIVARRAVCRGAIVARRDINASSRHEAANGSVPTPRRDLLPACFRSGAANLARFVRGQPWQHWGTTSDDPT